MEKAVNQSFQGATSEWLGIGGDSWTCARGIDSLSEEVFGAKDNREGRIGRCAPCLCNTPKWFLEC